MVPMLNYHDQAVCLLLCHWSVVALSWWQNRCKSLIVCPVKWRAWRSKLETDHAVARRGMEFGLSASLHLVHQTPAHINALVQTRLASYLFNSPRSMARFVWNLVGNSESRLIPTFDTNSFWRCTWLARNCSSFSTLAVLISNCFGQARCWPPIWASCPLSSLRVPWYA